MVSGTNAGTNYYVGSSYIIISIAYQRVIWAYIGSQRIVDAPVITGRPLMPTPRGLFAIQPYKESPSVLVGEDYESPVQMIPFLGNAYGLHDASFWQTQGFGGDLYLYLGSHGYGQYPVLCGPNHFTIPIPSARRSWYINHQTRKSMEKIMNKQVKV